MLLLDLVTTYDIGGFFMNIKDLVFSKNYVYNSKSYLYNYNNRFFRICSIKSCRLKGFEDMCLKNKTDKKEVDRISLSRTRRNIRELALCNDFDYFCTITVNSSKCDRYSLDEVQDNLRKCLRNIRNSSDNLKYLIITEKHKDGAFHFHGLMYGVSDLYLNKYGYLSCSKLDVLGFNSFSEIQSLEKVSNYLLKYITKDCVKNSRNQVYISSRGLKKAERSELNTNINNDIEFTYSNDFVDILDFDVQNCSRDFLLTIMNNMS